MFKNKEMSLPKQLHSQLLVYMREYLRTWPNEAQQKDLERIIRNAFMKVYANAEKPRAPKQTPS